MRDYAKLTRNLDLIRQAMKEIGPDIPAECRASYVEAMADIAYIQGFCQIPEERAMTDIIDDRLLNPGKTSTLSEVANELGIKLKK